MKAVGQGRERDDDWLHTWLASRKILESYEGENFKE